ncbi:hypothetical protein SK128_003416 [Halocaridina rubra]|uniref:Uncharacterized protein n=1 Tax=Halocaridina rubra TaxID=373956 RepID=A0AAN8X055_HALRR
MGGQTPPPEWVGGLENIPYNLGPAMLAEYKEFTINLKTNNTRMILRSYNVIGTIKGDIEPDRYVLIGNHRDAWGYGASDPSSGTAQMLETARVFGELMKEGWRPRRTLVFCSWGAEEYGLIGSTEWVEEHVDKIQERAVVYVNTDTCASGPILNAPASPLLWDSIVEISKQVPGVRDGPTVYDEWAAYHAVQNKSEPEMRTLGSGSDYAPFAFYSGVPCIDIWFRTDKNKYDISTYPYYHTGYETFYMVSTHIDPDFKIHQGCGRIAALLLRYFADSTIIPYSLEKFPVAIEEGLSNVMENGNREKLLDIYSKLPLLEESATNFTDAMNKFVQNINTAQDNMGPLEVRALNDLIMKLEQNFIIPTGLPGRPLIRHAVFAASKFDSYAASGFPGISDLLYDIDDLEGETLDQRKNEIRKHISDLTILMQRAVNLLKDYHFV